MTRADGRRPEQLRPVSLDTGFVRTALGSCLITQGGTRVICTASAEEGVPPFLRGRGQGWLTAEYAMLPASTGARKARDGLRRDGRGVEISRLIGRSLRQALDLSLLGERTLTIDCDVLEADGGTRCASVTGGFVALCQALDRMLAEGRLGESPLRRQVAAVSAGLVEELPCLDLCRLEDSAAQADLNAVLAGWGDLVELQGTGEGRPFTRKELDRLLALMGEGASQLMALQRRALGESAALTGAALPLVFASANPGKLAEMRELLKGRFLLLSQRDAGFPGEVPETGTSFEENAVLKAEAIRDAAGLPALADDSGLQVDALGGEPGIRSARYAGPHGDDRANTRLLLQRMEEFPEARSARFVCALALAVPGRPTRVFRGRCEGSIARAPLGDAGFGYDPVFVPAGSGLTFAQMGPGEKQAFSHRARAVRALREALG